jgi:hypothetical protein
MKARATILSSDSATNQIATDLVKFCHTDIATKKALDVVNIWCIVNTINIGDELC